MSIKSAKPMSPAVTDNGNYQSRGLSDADVARVMARRRDDQAPNTRRAYDRIGISWERWLAGRGVAASPLAVQVYLEEMIADRGWTLATVRQTLAGIVQRERANGGPSVQADPGLAEYMRAVARSLGRPQRQARPLTAEALVAIEAGCDIMSAATCALMRDGLLRVSEAAALRWRDVSIDIYGGLIRVGRTKTDPAGAGKTLYVGRHAVELLVEIARGPQETVLRGGHATLYRRIRQAGIDAGLGDGFSGHSPRVGMAQDLAAAGVPMAALMEVGRWRSTATALRYIERQQAQRSAVAHYYGVHL